MRAWNKPIVAFVEIDLTLSFLISFEQLTTAQRQTLSTIEDLKKAREKHRSVTSETSERIESLLTELDEAREKHEIYEQALGILPKELEELERKLNAAIEAREEKEAQLAQMVPISQVVEMETMFSETVCRLTNRVQTLENGQGLVSNNAVPGNIPGWQQRLQNGNELPPIPKGPKGSNQFMRNGQSQVQGKSSSNKGALIYLAESSAVLGNGRNKDTAAVSKKKTGVGAGSLW